MKLASQCLGLKSVNDSVDFSLQIIAILSCSSTSRVHACTDATDCLRFQCSPCRPRHTHSVLTLVVLNSKTGMENTACRAFLVCINIINHSSSNIVLEPTVKTRTKNKKFHNSINFINLIKRVFNKVEAKELIY